MVEELQVTIEDEAVVKAVVQEYGNKSLTQMIEWKQGTSVW